MPHAVDGVAVKDEDAAPSDRTNERPARRRRHAEQQGSEGIARRPATHYELSPPRDRVLLRGVAGVAPGIGVLRRYRRSWLRSDLYAGISVVAYMVPQVMAYTALVGVPPVAGLWTALAALIVYAAIGLLAGSVGRSRGDDRVDDRDGHRSAGGRRS